MPVVDLDRFELIPSSVVRIVDSVYIPIPIVASDHEYFSSDIKLPDCRVSTSR